MPNFVLVGLAAALGAIALAALFFYRTAKEMAMSGARGIMLLVLLMVSALGSGLGGASLSPTHLAVGAVLGFVFASFIFVATLLPARGFFWAGKALFTGLSTLAGGIMIFSVINFATIGGDATKKTGKQITDLTIGSAEAIQDQLASAKLQQSEHAKTIAFARDALRRAEDDIANDRASSEAGATLAKLEALASQPEEGTAAHDAWRSELRQFQADAGLAQDGLYGAQTRAAISAAKLRAQRSYATAASQMEVRRKEAQAALATALAMQEQQAKRIEGLQGDLAKYTDSAMTTASAQQDIIFSVSRGESWSVAMDRISPFSDTTDSNLAISFIIAGSVDFAIMLLSLTLALQTRVAVNDNPAPVQKPRLVEPRIEEPKVAALTPPEPKIEQRGAASPVAKAPSPEKPAPKPEKPFASQTVAKAKPQGKLWDNLSGIDWSEKMAAIKGHFDPASMENTVMPDAFARAVDGGPRSASSTPTDPKRMKTARGG